MRYNFNDLITQINTRLPTNATGLVTAAVLRGLLVDFVESVRSAASYLTRTGSPLTCACTAVYQSFANLMPVVSNSATDEVEGLTTTQAITVKLTGNYELSFDITAEGASNIQLDVTTLIDGVEYVFCVSRVQLMGAGKPVSIYNAADIHLNANQNVKLGFKIETGTGDVLVGPCALGVRLLPSRTS